MHMGIFEKSVVAAKIMKPFDSENPGNVLYDCMISSLYPKYKSYTPFFYKNNVYKNIRLKFPKI